MGVEKLLYYIQKCVQGFVNTSLEEAVPSYRTGSAEQQFSGKEEEKMCPYSLFSWEQSAAALTLMLFVP